MESSPRRARTTSRRRDLFRSPSSGGVRKGPAERRRVAAERPIYEAWDESDPKQGRTGEHVFFHGSVKRPVDESPVPRAVRQRLPSTRTLMTRGVNKCFTYDVPTVVSPIVTANWSYDIIPLSDIRVGPADYERIGNKITIHRLEIDFFMHYKQDQGHLLRFVFGAIYEPTPLTLFASPLNYFLDDTVGQPIMHPYQTDNACMAEVIYDKTFELANVPMVASTIGHTVPTSYITGYAVPGYAVPPDPSPGYAVPGYAVPTSTIQGHVVPPSLNEYPFQVKKISMTFDLHQEVYYVADGDPPNNISLVLLKSCYYSELLENTGHIVFRTFYNDC